MWLSRQLLLKVQDLAGVVVEVVLINCAHT